MLFPLTLLWTRCLKTVSMLKYNVETDVFSQFLIYFIDFFSRFSISDIIYSMSMRKSVMKRAHRKSIGSYSHQEMENSQNDPKSNSTINDSGLISFYELQHFYL